MALALLIAAGCSDNPDTPSPAEETLAEKIAGEWHCIISDIDADIYLELIAGGGFELYQKIGDGSHRLYRGTWTIDEASRTLNGKYNDGKAWGSSYETGISEDKNTLTLAPKNGAAKDEQIYRRETIPSVVKDKCVVIVKSDCSEEAVL